MRRARDRRRAEEDQASQQSAGVMRSPHSAAGALAVTVGNRAFATLARQMLEAERSRHWDDIDEDTGPLPQRERRERPSLEEEELRPRPVTKPTPMPMPMPTPTPTPTPSDDSEVPRGPTPCPKGRGTPGDHVWYWKNRLTGEEKVSWTVNLPQQAWFGTTVKNEYHGNGKDIYLFVFHAGDKVLRGQPHMLNYKGSYAWLNNNPGNLTGPPYWGAYEGKLSWNSFLIFPTREMGKRAIAPFLKNPGGRYLDLTIRQAFRTYAPKGHGLNDPDRYATQVGQHIGKDPDKVFIRDLTKQDMVAVADGIEKVEGTIPGDPYTRASLPAAIQAELP